MVASQVKGDPNTDLKHHTPYYVDPKKVRTALKGSYRDTVGVQRVSLANIYLNPKP